jgi:hypothetical protein
LNDIEFTCLTTIAHHHQEKLDKQAQEASKVTLNSGFSAEEETGGVESRHRKIGTAQTSAFQDRLRRHKQSLKRHSSSGEEIDNDPHQDGGRHAWAKIHFEAESSKVGALLGQLAHLVAKAPVAFDFYGRAVPFPVLMEIYQQYFPIVADFDLDWEKGRERRRRGARKEHFQHSLKDKLLPIPASPITQTTPKRLHILFSSIFWSQIIQQNYQHPQEQSVHHSHHHTPHQRSREHSPSAFSPATPSSHPVPPLTLTSKQSMLRYFKEHPNLALGAHSALLQVPSRAHFHSTQQLCLPTSPPLSLSRQLLPSPTPTG